MPDYFAQFSAMPDAELRDRYEEIDEYEGAAREALTQAYEKRFSQLDAGNPALEYDSDSDNIEGSMMAFLLILIGIIGILGSAIGIIADFLGIVALARIDELLISLVGGLLIVSTGLILNTLTKTMNAVFAILRRTK